MQCWIFHVDVNDFWLNAGGLEHALSCVIKPMLTSLSPTSKGYVRSEYIGTLGCPPSPRLCANELNSLMGLDQCSLDRKPLHNIDEGAITT